MSRFFIYPYKQASAGARQLAEALGAKVLRRENSKYRGQPGDVIINWGASDCPYPLALNAHKEEATDKLAFFNQCAESPYVPLAADCIEDARKLGYPVVCRTKLNGKDGEGIVIANSADELVPAPLYVKYVKKAAEYRVHLGRGKDGYTSVIGVQRKLRVRGLAEGRDFQVRNYNNGYRYFWTWQGEPVLNICPRTVLVAAREVFDLFPCLTFGALDVIYNEHEEKGYVLEINTAPGLAEGTANFYASFFKEYAEEPVIDPEAKLADFAEDEPEPEQDFSDIDKVFLAGIMEAKPVDMRAAFRWGWQSALAGDRIDVV